MRFRLAIIALILLDQGAALAQVFVYPRRPSQSAVRYRDFNWHHIDIRRAEGAEEASWESGPRLHKSAPIAGAPEAPDWAWRGGERRDWLHREDRSEVGNHGLWPDADLPELPLEERTLPLPPPQVQHRTMREPDWSKSGGVRLYFYEGEREVAERAAASIAESYERLARDFQYVPTRTVPYFLYNTYQEFLQTNLFPIQEGVLGVTAVEGLEMALPYFGDYRMFRDVSTHELAHQFMLQKLRSVGDEAGADTSLARELPLWFIEGLAEYYAQDGFDEETRTLLRDMVANAQPDRGYAMLGFFAERQFSFLWTYKMGQARCAFLEQTYGRGTLQRILEQSYRLVDSDRATSEKNGVGSFGKLLEEVTGDRVETIAMRFDSWAKRRTYPAFLRARHRPEMLRHVRGDDTLQAMTASPDGRLLMYRGFDMETNRVVLRLFDFRRAGDAVMVAGDGQPGIESLRPIASRNFTVASGALAFAAEHRGRDVIYWQDYEHDAKRQKKGADERWKVRLRLGKRVRFDVAKRGIISADWLTLSPDGERLAFVGLSKSGQKDVYMLAPDDDGGFTLQQVTGDHHAERGLAWGPDGLVFTSDATEHGRFNLFRAREQGSAWKLERLTTESRDHRDPVALGDGRVFFVAYDELGGNLYEATRSGPVRRTSVPTELLDPSPGPGDRLWVLHYYRGSRRPAALSKTLFVEGSSDLEQSAIPRPGRLSLDAATPYDAFSLDNWQIDNVFGIFGASADGIFGQGVAVASDRLRNHSLIMTAVAFGSLELMDGTLFYTNQEHRNVWGAGIFQDLSFNVDRSMEDDEDLLFLSGQRFFGANGIVRRPLDRFRYVQGGLSVGGVTHFLTDDTRSMLADGDLNGTGRDLVDDWEDQQDGLSLRTEASLSYGYNTLRYHPFTGPIGGSSMLLEGVATAQPTDGELAGRVRIDGERYIHLLGRSNIMLRAGAGQSFGGDIARNYFLSSFDTLRGVPFGDWDILVGRSFLFTTAEVQFPLDHLIQIAIADLEGVVGVDAGGVADDPAGLWDRRVANGVAGVNFGIAFMVLRLHFAKPIDLRGDLLPNEGDWNVNFSIGYRYQ